MSRYRHLEHLSICTSRPCQWAAMWLRHQAAKCPVSDLLPLHNRSRECITHMTTRDSGHPLRIGLTRNTIGR
ncbi:unnamed protein product [Acanthoscelides obtectus]|uniref:Uncharacterized protein n=1 Tax=Acanthoscelides obtectus TaxID=200917 RepID=A0A9P0KST8_ACAOB|nr:unnamed protein product [Acanthoscelides obtectus]CAK1655823.1 hypothetical protein AOBTE_LOCUS19366 [Acanthoscelides obtectus]